MASSSSCGARGRKIEHKGGRGERRGEEPQEKATLTAPPRARWEKQVDNMGQEYVIIDTDGEIHALEQRTIQGRLASPTPHAPALPHSRGGPENPPSHPD